MTGYFKVTVLEGENIEQGLDELTDYAMSHPDSRLTIDQNSGQIEDRNRREDGSDIPVSERKGEEDDGDDIAGVSVTKISKEDEDTEETRKMMAELGWTKESTNGEPPDWTYHGTGHGRVIRATKIAEADADDAGPAAPKTDSKKNKKQKKHKEE